MLAGVGVAVAAEGELDRVHAFLEKHLIGHTLEDSATTKIGEGKVETEFLRRTQFLRLQRSGGEMPNISFDVIILIKQSLYDLGPDGKRLNQPPRVKNRSLVQRVSLQGMNSTGKLVGSSVTLSSSVSTFTGSGDSVEATVVDGKLRLVKRTSLYFDGFAAGGKYTPGATETTQEYSVVDGKLVSQTRELGFLVDPATLERKPSGHDVKMAGNEVEGLF